MPNNVRNKVVFETKEDFYAASFLLWDQNEKRVDFNILIPTPITVYLGNTNRRDETDFKSNWRTWSIENWGTKWNAYESEILPDEFAFAFDTAWSPPYPVIVAIANSLPGVNFIHAYVCEHTEYWGLEKWKHGERISISQDFQESFIIAYGREYMEDYVQERKEDAIEYNETFEWPPQLAECYKL